VNPYDTTGPEYVKWNDRIAWICVGVLVLFVIFGR